MSNHRQPAVAADLEKVIDAVLAQMAREDPSSEKYAKMAEQLAGLYKLKEQDAPKRVSPDTWALIAANLAGIVLILQYEKIHVVTSKALSFVQKAR